MKRWALGVALVLCGSVIEVRGNPPPPRERIPRERPPAVAIGAQNADLVVEIDERAKEARLQIPAGLLTQAGKPRLGADAGRVPTVIAGLALACAFVSGGFWLARRRSGRALILLVAMSLLAAGGSAVFANKAAPPEPRRPPTVALPANIKLSSKIVLEVVANGDKVKLIVNKEMVTPVPRPSDGSD